MEPSQTGLSKALVLLSFLFLFSNVTSVTRSWPWWEDLYQEVGECCQAEFRYILEGLLTGTLLQSSSHKPVHTCAHRAINPSWEGAHSLTHPWRRGRGLGVCQNQNFPGLGTVCHSLSLQALVSSSVGGSNDISGKLGELTAGKTHLGWGAGT